MFISNRAKSTTKGTTLFSVACMFQFLEQILLVHTAEDRTSQVFHLSVAAATSSVVALVSAFLAASFSFSSLISLNFLMFSVKSGPLYKVMKSFAFLLSPLDPATVIVLVLISLKVAYLFLWKQRRVKII